MIPEEDIMKIRKKNEELAESARNAVKNLEEIAEIFKKLSWRSGYVSYIDPVASVAELSQDDKTKAAVFISNVGIPASMAGTSLRLMIKSIAEPNEATRKVMGRYGLTQKDIDPSTHGLVEIMNILEGNGVDIAGALEIFGLDCDPRMEEIIKDGKTDLSYYTGDFNYTFF